MIHYINVEKRKLVGRNNQVNTLPIVLDYSTVEELQFQFINCQNQIQDISGLSGLYFAGSVQMGQPSYDLLFLSEEYTIENNILTFKCDTYTLNYLNKIKKKNTEINIEIGQISLNEKRVMLRDYALACPRVYVEGLTPAQIDSHEYWTATETKEYVDEAIEEATSGIVISGYVTEEQFEEGLATKQNVIDDENKLSYELLSGTPSIPTDYLSGISLNGTPATVEDKVVNIPRTSQSDWGVVKVNPGVGIGADSGQIYTIRAESAEIAARTQNFKPIVPSNLNEAVKAALTDANHMTLTDAEKTTAQTVLGVDAITSGYATEQYVDNAVSGKADKSEIPTKTSDLDNDSGFITTDALSGYATETALSTHTSDTTIHVTAEDKETWNGKQDAITVDNKLDYALLSGTPEVPTVEWGGISGTLSAQTDLQNALNAKAEQTDVDAISGELKEIDDTLQDYIDKHTPLYFETLVANNKIKLHNFGVPDVALKYSLDNVNWNDYTIDSEITLTNVGDKVYFKGNNTTFYQNIGGYVSNCVFQMTENANVGGNLISIMNEACIQVQVPQHGMEGLFRESKVVDASKLIMPNKASNYSFNAMFAEDTVLTTSPIIPQIPNWPTSVYRVMFAGCSSLNKVTFNSTTWNTSSTEYWLRNVSLTGTFYCPSGLDTTTRGESKIPEGWTVVNI